MEKIAVIGLGHAGLSLACVIAEAGFDVIGIDKNLDLCEKIDYGKNPFIDEPILTEYLKKYGGKKIWATTHYYKARESNFFIIVVPLFLKDRHQPDFSILEDTVRMVGSMLKQGDCVVIETTVPPLTTETSIRVWLEEESGLKVGDFYLAHSPEQIMTGLSIDRLKNFPKVIGGINEDSTKKVFKVYKRFIPNIHRASSCRVAEFKKVIEGCYRFVNISLSNELFKIADLLDIDFEESKYLANGEYCNLLKPSIGIGGHCIPVYPWFLINQMEKIGREEDSIMLLSAFITDKTMIFFWEDKILQECSKFEKPLKAINVCISGISYREGVKSTHNSKSLKLAKNLMKKGFTVSVYDKMYTSYEIERMGFVYGKPENADIIFYTTIPPKIVVRR